MSAVSAPTAPPSRGLPEATVLIVWPSIAGTWAGRCLGRWYESVPRWGFLAVFHLRNLVILATAPLGAALFARTHAPFVCRRYHLTNKRLRIEQGYSCRLVDEVAFEDFDRVETERLPGQGWFGASDLLLKRGDALVRRLPGIAHPAGFRQALLKMRAIRLALAEPGVRRAE